MRCNILATEKIYIWNDGEMRSELNSTEKLFEKHSSKPYNPKLANVFFKSGMIEAWGRGFDKIKEACVKYNGRLPEYNISASGIMVLCKTCDKYLELLSGNENNSLTSDERIMSEKECMIKMIIEYHGQNGYNLGISAFTSHKQTTKSYQNDTILREESIQSMSCQQQEKEFE